MDGASFTIELGVTSLFGFIIVRKLIRNLYSHYTPVLDSAEEERRVPLLGKKQGRS